MENIHIEIDVKKAALDELSADDRELVERAKAMTANSYSPYSRFSVGAAIRLADGAVYGGANQENASFPVGSCAERSAFFFAQASQPDVPPVAIAIAAATNGHFTAAPVTPCGMCRQALLEAETRYGQPIRILLFGAEATYVVNSFKDLLPLTFDGSELEC